MAKRRPVFALSEVERELGYSINSLNYPDDAAKRFYSDLSPVPESADERAQREVEERAKQSLCEYIPVLEGCSPVIGIPQTTAYGQDTIIFTCRSLVGCYNFTADIHFGFGLHLSLMLTKGEAGMAIAVSKLQPDYVCELGPMFSRLPKEIRQQIYGFAIPTGEWKTVDIDRPRCNFPEGIGDPSGFYFPLNNLGLLALNKQIRQEVLPLAYRSVRFRLDDIDDLIKLLLGIGDLGRDNIESLEFSWQSKSESEFQWTEALLDIEQPSTLPSIHVASCVKLLRQCKNLKFLCLSFDSDLISCNSPDTQVMDAGLHALRSIRGVERLAICDLAFEPLDRPEFVWWLQEAMQSSRQEQEKEWTSDTLKLV